MLIHIYFCNVFFFINVLISIYNIIYIIYLWLCLCLSTDVSASVWQLLVCDCTGPPPCQCPLFPIPALMSQSLWMQPSVQQHSDVNVFTLCVLPLLQWGALTSTYRHSLNFSRTHSLSSSKQTQFLLYKHSLFFTC